MNLIDKFLKYKKDIMGEADKSIIAYRDSLIKFYEFLKVNIESDEDIISIKNDKVKEYLYFLNEKGNSASTKNQKLSIIKSFYKYLEQEEDLSIDYKILTIKYSKKEQKVKPWLDEDECQNLIYNATELRTKAIITFLLTTGARISEINDITVDDVYNGYAVINGKGNKQRTLYFNNEIYNTMPILLRYIDIKRNKIIKKTGIKTNQLFISNEGNNIKRENFTKSLKRYAQKAGLKDWETISPHSLRHSCGSNALRRGVDIATVRDMLGHSNIFTTNTYSHSNEDLIRNAMEGKKNG